MGNHAAWHPTEQTLSDFSLGKLDDSRAELINNHLNECPDCQRLVAEMSSDSFLGRLRGDHGRLETGPLMGSSLAGLSWSRWGNWIRWNHPRPVRCLRGLPTIPTTRSSASSVRAAWARSISPRTGSWAGTRC